MNRYIQHLWLGDAGDGLYWRQSRVSACVFLCEERCADELIYAVLEPEEWARWHDASYPIDLSEDCTRDSVIPEHLCVFGRCSNDTQVSACPPECSD